MHKLTPSTILLTVLFALECSGQEVSQDISWKAGPRLPHASEYQTFGVHGEVIYLAGGTNADPGLAFDTGTETWIEIPGLPVLRDFSAGAVVNDFFYVCGGIDETHGATRSVEMLDIRQQKWSSAPPMHDIRSRFPAVACNGKLYVFGGLDVDPDGNYGNLASAESYDPAIGRWQGIAPMSVARHGHAATVLGDAIYVAGGYTDTGQTGLLERYDPVENAWTTLAPMPTPRGFHGLVAVRGQLFAIAGRIYAGPAAVEAYDPDQHSWHSLSPLDGRLNRFAAAVIGDKIYVIGGEEDPDGVRIGTLGAKR